MMASGSAAPPWADEVAELVTAEGAGSDEGRPSAGVSMRYLKKIKRREEWKVQTRSGKKETVRTKRGNAVRH